MFLFISREGLADRWEQLLRLEFAWKRVKKHVLLPKTLKPTYHAYLPHLPEYPEQVLLTFSQFLNVISIYDYN